MHRKPVRPRLTAVPSCGASRHPAPAGLAFWAIATFAVTLSSAMAQISYLDNGVVRVGVDLARGGAISYLSESGSSANVVNIRDLGRYIQQSYYSGPDPFIPPGATQHPAYAGWGWNPVQAGDVYNHRSLVIAESNDGDTLYVKCVPKQWALRNVDSECTMEAWITLEQNRVHVRNRLVNSRSDTTRYSARHQELPAVYTVGTLHRLFAYTGSEPFTGDDLTRIINSGPPWAYWSSSENWSALVNDEDWGLGIFLPGAVLTVGGFHGSPGWGGPAHNNTGYMAPLHTDLLDHDIVYEYEYTLILGDLLDDIRAHVYSQAPAAGPHHVFATDRRHCVPHNLSDGSPPYAGYWRLTLNQADPQILLPPGLWQASEVPRIFITCAHHTQASEAEVFFSGADGVFSGDKRLSVPIVPDGQVRTYEVDLASHLLYAGVMTRLRFDPIHTQNLGDRVDLYAIGTECVTSVPPAVEAAGPGPAITAAVPNPFNPRTTITFALPHATAVTLTVFDLRGRRVRTVLRDIRMQAGLHSASWDGLRERGEQAPAGIYLVRLSGDGVLAPAVKLTLMP